MPRLACWSCGRQLYTVSPLEALFAEERRCPRCGAFLSAERREHERREAMRRENAAGDPGPSAAGEQRVVERRRSRRRKGDTGFVADGDGSIG